VSPQAGRADQEGRDEIVNNYGAGDGSERRSDKLAHILSPDGPWHLAGLLRVPQEYVHMSHKHPWSFISIKHALKLYLRVERGDEDVDPKTGRKKQFDIIIETPVNILSVRPFFTLLLVSNLLTWFHAALLPSGLGNAS
jgi:hypothetical protein